MARHWHFDWRLLVFCGLFLPLLLSLGVWQLNRAAEKKELLTSWQSQATESTWAELVAEQPMPGRPVTLTGLFSDRTWLLDNRTRKGQAGYEVLTLFLPLQGPPVVVNRGWLPAPRTRDLLPAVTSPDGVVTLAGRLADYPVPPVLAQSPEQDGQWPRRVQALPRQQVAIEVVSPAPVIVTLTDDDQPGAYLTGPAPNVMGPQVHYGYALQWFALAAALTILTVVASYRKAPSGLGKNRKTGADNDNDNG